MLWVPGARQTRHGTVFSPYTPATSTPLQNLSFDFAPLLAQAFAHTDERAGDSEATDSALLDIDTEYPPLDPMTTVDDVPRGRVQSPPPPSKRRRISPAFDDMLEGSKPLTHAHRKRAEKRAREKHARAHTPRASTLAAHVAPALIAPLQTALDTSTLPVAHGAYAAKVEDGKEKLGAKKRRYLDELVQMGFQVVPWNGFDARPLVDVHGRIFAVLVGQPRCPSWDADVWRAFDAIIKEGENAAFPSNMKKHRRGLYAALNVGLSYGKGQRVPSRLRNPHYEPLLNRLLSMPAICRMATFASAAFALWAPRLHQYYRAHNDALHAHLPHLRRNFEHSVFSCAAFNFGPRVCTSRHRDGLNAPFGWCGIQAAGAFDSTKGGHLVLWDLKLAVEFPHGALILVPSATIAHSNVPVGPEETRISFTQFTAGGLMRYVDNGYRTEGELEEQDPEEFARMILEKDSRWQMGLGLLSTLDELRENTVTE